MAKTDIGPKIGIEGEAQFRRELAQINQGLKTLDSEAKAVAASMQDETDAEKKAAAQKDVLNRQILSQREKLEKLQSGLEASAKKYGEADTRTQKWQKAVFDATKDLADMEHELKDLDGSVDEATGSMEDAEAAAMGWADVMKGQLCADLVKNGISAVAGLIRDQAAALWDASKAGAAYADTYNTMSATSGLSTETLQEYAYMADLVDVSVETLTGAQTKLISSMRGARDGTGAAAEAWAALGVDIEDADGNLRSAEDAMRDTLDALGKLENDTERDAAAMAIFGRSAQDLNPLIKAGAEQIAKLRKEAHDTGYVLSGSALTALNKQQDAMDRLGKRVEAVSNGFAAKMAPGITKGAEALNEAFDNPRVKQGLDVVAEGLGGIITGAAELASKALPELFNVFTLGDERLKYLTDDQLALVQSVDESRQAHEEMTATYKANAMEIVDEAKRTEGLWKELQTLVGENGEVKKADEERVNYINSELKEALGVQMELEDGILKGYKEQQKEIEKLIQKREAEALIAAGADQFAQAEKERKEALERAAKLAPSYEKALRDMERAQRDYAKAVDYANKKEADGVWSDDKALKYINNALEARKKAEKTYEQLAEEYEAARGTAAQYYADVERWQRAQTAAANGNYREVIRILTDEFGVTLDYYNRKKQLNEQEKKDLKAKISDMELTIAEYKRNLSAGLAGFSEAGLAELEEYVAEAKRILDGKAVGEAFLDGLIRGLKNKNKNREVASAAASVAFNVQNQTKNVLMIASPSKVATWMGEMWDEGLVRGLLDNRGDVANASRIVAGAFVGPAAAAVQTASYTGGTTLAPIGAGAGGSTSSSSVRIGTIPISITTQGPVDARALAAEISVQLSDTLRQAQRGGRV